LNLTGIRKRNNSL